VEFDSQVCEEGSSIEKTVLNPEEEMHSDANKGSASKPISVVTDD